MSRRYSEENWRHKGDEDFERVRGRGRGRRRGRGRGRSSATGSGFSEDYFTVLHTQRYERDAPPLPPPTVLGSFSVDSEKNIHFDNSMMSVLSSKYLPDGLSMKVDLDLNKGRDKINPYTIPAHAFRNLLKWILENQEKVAAEDSSDRLTADFVCSRILLKKIMQAPYASANHNSAEWVMLAKYFKGTVYLVTEVLERDEIMTMEASSPPEMTMEIRSLVDIYGHKFKQYMTGGDPDDVLECNCQFRCVLQLQLKEMSLLFAPVADAVDPSSHKEDFKDMNSFVRLKVRMESAHPKSERNYRRFTLNDWWIENKLNGLPRLLVGTRNSEGVVHTLQMLQTDDFPGLCQGEWEPSVCINFLHLFLDFVKRRVVAEPDVIHRFEKSAPELHKIRHSCDPNQNDFLPDWYKEELFNTQDEESDRSRGSDSRDHEKCHPISDTHP